MTNFHEYPSNAWKHKEWKTSNRTHLIPRSPTPTAASLQSSTSTVSVAARVTRAPASCLQSCRDAFRNSILPYDKDFDKICAILADEKDDAVFSTLYGCDEGCGVVINGTGQGQDPNVNWAVARCQSLGFTNVVDPGSPLSTSLATTLTSNSLNGLTFSDRPTSQVSPTNRSGNNEPTTTFSQISTSSIPQTPSPSTLSTLLMPSTSSGGISTSTVTITAAKPPIMSHSTLTTFVTTFSTTTTFISISPTPTSVHDLQASIPVVSPTTSLYLDPSETPVYPAPLPSSVPVTHSKMSTNAIVGLVLAFIGIFFLMSAATIILLACRKERARRRTCTCKSAHRQPRPGDTEGGYQSPTPSNIEKSLPPLPSPKEIESDRCACCNNESSETIGFPYPEFPSLFRSKSQRASSQSKGLARMLSTSSRKSQNILTSSVLQEKESDKPPTSPTILTINGIRHEIHHPAPNGDLTVDAQGIRWPEQIILRGVAKELVEWSKEYDRKTAERRAKLYDLEKGRQEKERRFTFKERKMYGGHGRSETMLDLPRRMTRVLPLDPLLMNEQELEKANVKKVRSTMPAIPTNTGLERSTLFP